MLRAPGPPIPVAAGLPGCRAAGLGDHTEFAAKPELAERLVTRFLDTGSRAAWVAGDGVYGAFLAVIRANEHQGHPSPDELIPLTFWWSRNPTSRMS